MNRKIFLHNRKNLLILFVIISLTVTVFSGCTRANQPDTIRLSIAEQYGLAYAPLQIMKMKGFLETEIAQIAPGAAVQVTWQKLANTAAIQEAMVAGALDVAFVGIPPFLIGADQGMPWYIFTGLSECPVELYVNDPSMVSLKDLADQGKIAVPQPGSIQHILLAMAAEKSMGDPGRFDQQLISMKHPDGLQALIHHVDIVAQYTSPPYNFIAADTPGLHRLSSGEEAMGEPYSFIVGIAQKPFLENEITFKAFQRALARSIAFIRDNPDQTSELLAKSYELSVPITQEYLYHREIVYTQEVKGLHSFAQFMAKTGYIKDDYDEEKLIWPTS